MADLTISLQNRLTLTHALFISLALGVLTIVINIFTGFFFTALVKDNITEKSGNIVSSIAEQYNPMSRSFDTVTVEAMGMFFVHEGYLVTVEDERGNPVWDARSCDMEQCAAVISSITERMESTFRVNGIMQTEVYPLRYAGRTIGRVLIETYGPFFYSETETQFLRSINRLLLTATAVLTLFSIIISLVLSRAIAKPILKAGEAARKIAQAHGIPGSRNAEAAAPVIRINERYKTRELAGLSRSINELAAELEEGERRQKQLTADIAHELRTPLTCLQGSIEAMIDGVYQADTDHLQSCHEEVIRLAKLAEDLNTLAGLEWENIVLNKTEFDLAVLLRTTAEQFKATALEKSITIKLDLAESHITADYDRIKQVFVNLLSNAVKYTDRGTITVTVEKAAGVGVSWEVSVADTGIGIMETDLPHIFERFYRSDKSRSRSTGGAGIGLAISAAIVQAHGGTIAAESSSIGSVFRVRL
ncbi:sensor histidine kinase [Spirochaetia bacterium]|nr:sensor histidine kinase [Spirochaetia bacterium]